MVQVTKNCIYYHNISRSYFKSYHIISKQFENKINTFIGKQNRKLLSLIQ